MYTKSICEFTHWFDLHACISIHFHWRRPSKFCILIFKWNLGADLFELKPISALLWIWTQFCTNCGKRGTNIFNLYSAYICHEQFFSSRRKNSDWIEFDWALMCSEGPIADWICLTDLSYSIWIFRLRCFLCV